MGLSLPREGVPVSQGLSAMMGIESQCPILRALRLTIWVGQKFRSGFSIT